MSTTAAAVGWPGLIAAYADRVVVPPGARVVTLLEGGTPLVPADTLSDRVNAQVYLKVEGANPTGSFKDRGMTVAVTHALASGAKAVICASTGNTSASAAAYAARAGLTSAVLVPQGKISAGKLAQAVAYGAKILQIEGNFAKMKSLMGQAQKLAYDVQNIDQQFNSTYQNFATGKTSSQLVDGAHQRWQDSLAAYQDALKTGATAVGNIDGTRTTKASEAAAADESSDAARSADDADAPHGEPRTGA